MDHSDKDTVTERSAPLQRQGRRGRQAEAARNDLRVLDAARDVIAAQGFDAPVSAIAQRAGVGMGTLYRRYGSKAELLQRLCVLAMEQAIEAAQDGLADEDPWRGLTGYVRACVAFHSGALAPLAGRIETTPEMRETAKRSFRLLDRLVERAPVRPDVTPLDVAWLTELFARTRPRGGVPDVTTDGEAVVEWSPEAGPRDGFAAGEDRRVHDRLLAIALDGLRADAGRASLSGPAPTREHYQGRWR